MRTTSYTLALIISLVALIVALAALILLLAGAIGYFLFFKGR